MATNGQFRRVVVTGHGGICNVGHESQPIWDHMVAGKPDMRLMDRFDGDRWAVKFGGAVWDWDPTIKLDRAETKRLDRFAQLALWAAIEAVNNAGIDFAKEDPYRCGVVIGSGVGGVATIEEYIEKMHEKGPHRVTPFLVPRLMVNAGSGNVSIRYGLKGPNNATATACASAANAIGDAFQIIQDGDADLMVCGGAEAAMTQLCMAGFMVMKALSTRNEDPNGASRPFDKDRDGFVLAEGAGIIVLEELEHARKRGAKIYAELLGYGSSGDAGHITAPDPEGRGAAHCMEMALKDARLNPEQIEFINTHGTSTPLGDVAEVLAIKRVFKDHAPKIAITSTKGVTGHTLGASGGIESLSVVRTIDEKVMPPTANLEHPDDGFDLDFVMHDAREQPVRYALNNSFGFGGHNVSLVFGRLD